MKVSPKRIFDLSVDALRIEDSYLRESARLNRGYAGSNAGILLFNNERFYQYVIARHLVGKVSSRIAAEWQRHDLAFLREDGSPELIVEMKRWMSSEGRSELPGIREDIKKLERRESCTGLVFIISSNPAKILPQSNLEFLANRLQRKPEEFFVGQFPTYSVEGNENVFWLAGYETNAN